MKPTTIICYVLFFLAVVASIAEMWFQWWDIGTFIKLLITDAGLFAIVFVIGFLVKESRDNKKIGNDEL